MITLHGFAASNYYNLVKHVLLYKQVPFQEHLVYGGSEELMALNPAGKVPVITTPEGHNISESSVICDFIEQTYPSIALYPEDATERAVVKQIMKVAELYLELPSRRFIPYALSGTDIPDSVKNEVRQVLNRAVMALRHLCKFSPWLRGEQFSMADIYVYYVNTIVNSFATKQLDWDVLADIPGMKQWEEAMRQSDITQAVEDARQANLPEFMQKVTAQIQAAHASK